MANPNHDPKTGQFTSKAGGLAAGLGEEYSRRKAAAPVTIKYVRNNNGMRQVGGFSQDIEPWGRYMSEGTGGESLQKGWESGSVTFANPLVVEHADGGWKEALSKQFDGATGKTLSKRLIAAGYDGVISQDKYGTAEIVDVRPKGKRGHKVSRRG